MTKQHTTTVKLPKSLHQKMMEQVICDGYGMRGKSKWMGEAIEDFLSLSNFPELVDIADDLENLSEIVSLRLSDPLARDLDQAVVRVRAEYPVLEGVKSNIIRASILQRLIHPSSTIS
ncbi:MAG: hypothetical protein ACE365_01840 [Gammaproteobacteria bacterium]